MLDRGKLSDARTPAEAGANGGRIALLLAGCAAVFLLVLLPYLPGLLGAAVFYVIAAPVQRRLAPVLPPRVSAAGVAIVLLLVLALPGSWLLTTAANEAVAALRGFERSGLLTRLSGTTVAGVDLGAQVSGAGARLLAWLPSNALAVFGTATRATLNLAIALIGLYYLLVQGGDLGTHLRLILPVSEAGFERLRRRFVEATEAMLLGTFLTAALQGTLVGLAFALVGLPGAVFWGMVTAGVAVLPVLGSALVWLPATGYLALSGRYGAALFMLVAGAVVVSNLDNLVWLAVFRRVSGIHPMLTLVGALGGMRVFGVLGVLFGPLALSWFFELLRTWEEMRHPPPLAALPPPLPG